MEPKAATVFNEVRALLLGRLAGERERLGLTQAEIAQRTGLSRMTIQRLESNGADAQLSSFIAYACAVGLGPELREAPDLNEALGQALSHHSAGLSLAEEAQPWRSRGRIAAFDQAWRLLNAHQRTASRLIPGLSQPQATAMATVVAWLGTDQGVEFLREVLTSQGHEVADIVAAQAVVGSHPSHSAIDAKAAGRGDVCHQSSTPQRLDEAGFKPAKNQ